MTPHQYVEELEWQFRSDDPRSAYMLWLDQRDHQVDTQLSAEDRHRLRSTLHLLLQMAAGLGWDTGDRQATGQQRQSV